MKKKKSPSAPATAHTIIHQVCCAQCGSKINVKQQDYKIQLKTVDKNGKDVGVAILDAAKVTSIKVDGHNCVFTILKSKSPTVTKEYYMRCTLQEWEFLAEYGFIQTARGTISNIAQVEHVKKDRLYLNHIEKSEPVTDTYKVKVSDALKFWFNIDHRFSC